MDTQDTSRDDMPHDDGSLDDIGYEAAMPDLLGLAPDADVD